MEIADLYAPPEVLAALQNGKRTGQWLRAKCPFCDPAGRKGRSLVASHIGYGRDKSKPGWTCHRCHAEKEQARCLKRGSFEYDPEALKMDEQKRREIALKIYSNSGPVRTGDVVDTYLRKERGLAPCGLTWPSSIRFIRSVHPSDRDRRDYNARKKYPIMICSVVDSDGVQTGIHRTFLTETGQKNRSIEPNKMTMGVIRGCAVRLGVDSDSILLAEGIESAQAAWMMLGIDCVPWATISAQGMRDIVIPKHVKRVIIVPDRDKDKVRNGRNVGKAGQKAGFALLGRLKKQDGLEVSIKFPPAGLTDFADALVGSKTA